MEKPFLLPPLCPSKQFWPKQSLENKKKQIKAKQNNTSIDNQHMLTKKPKTQRTKKQNKNNPFQVNSKECSSRKKFTHIFLSVGGHMVLG